MTKTYIGMIPDHLDESSMWRADYRIIHHPWVSSFNRSCNLTALWSISRDLPFVMKIMTAAKRDKP